MSRYQVRVDPDFFDDLDQQLGAERGPHGEPSRRDFDLYELLPIVDYVAEHFDQLGQEIDGRPDYRTLVVPGRLVYSVGVFAQLAPDGAVDLMGVVIDFAAPGDDPDPEDDPDQ